MSVICETERLVIRQFKLTDADFIIELLNQESFIRFIGDKQVRSVSDAEYYLNKGPLASYTVWVWT
ncbi:acetyltransferase [Vibrio sp. JCM 19236]|nr:acetyltransferase [Vibrio sp. JCM 19236]